MGLIALVQYYRSKPRLLLYDHFDAKQLDTNLWTRGHADLGRLDTGHRSFRAEPSGGELVLLAEADHADRWSVGESGWVELKHDLRKLAPCRIELQVAGKAVQGVR